MPRIAGRRPMRRKQERANEEVKRDWGAYYKTLVSRYRQTIKRREDKIEKILSEISGIKADLKKGFRKKEVELNAKIRSLETQLRNQIQKYKDFQKRKGQRHRSIIHKTRYKTYQSPKGIKRYEERLSQLSEATTGTSYLEDYEKHVKLLSFVESYNRDKDQQCQITTNHYYVLLTLLFLRFDNGLGVTAPKIKIPTLSPHIIRKTLNHLVDLNMADKNKLRFRITILGEDIINRVRKNTIKDSSYTIEAIKKGTINE